MNETLLTPRSLQSIIPYTPTSSPQLSEMVYEMILAHFLASDRPVRRPLPCPPRSNIDEPRCSALAGSPSADRDLASGDLQPLERDQRDRGRPGRSTQGQGPYGLPGRTVRLVFFLWPPFSAVVSSFHRDSLLSLCRYLHNHQPEKALPYFLRLRRMGVFNLIRDFNLFTSVRDQALLLVEFDMELSASPSLGSPAANEGVGDAVPVVPGAGVSKSRHERAMSPVTKLGIVDMARRETGTGKHGKAIQLLVDHSHSIPVCPCLFQRRDVRSDSLEPHSRSVVS